AGIRGEPTRSASMLLRNACVTSAFAFVSLTPGFVRAIMSIHPQWYVVHQDSSFKNPPRAACEAPYAVIGMKYAGGSLGQRPTKPGADTPMISYTSGPIWTLVPRISFLPPYSVCHRA